MFTTKEREREREKVGSFDRLVSSPCNTEQQGIDTLSYFQLEVYIIHMRTETLPRLHA